MTRGSREQLESEGTFPSLNLFASVLPVAVTMAILNGPCGVVSCFNYVPHSCHVYVVSLAL